MSAIDPNKCLPQELTVESVDDILYAIGLSFDSLRDSPKRPKIFNPFLISAIISIFLVKEFITILLDEKNEQTFETIGSLGHLMGLRLHVSIAIILLSILAFGSQLIHYYNHRNGIKLTFLRVFQMMSGLVSPKSLGLTDNKEIGMLLRKTRVLSKFLWWNNNVFGQLITFVIFNGLNLIQANSLSVILYGIIHSFLLNLWALYVSHLIGTQIMCFYIICLYLKIKINSMNERLIEMKRRKRFIRIRETLLSFDSLYSEINEYNTTFWSKFLLVFWLTFGSFNVVFLYIILFNSLNFFIKIVLVYALLFWFFCFLFVIFTASSVTYYSNKSYKTLNSLIISYSKHNKHRYYTRFSTKMKVKT